MVYRGPSRGCLECRRRRVRCDLKQPACGNCLRRKFPCSGILPAQDGLRFFDETLAIAQLVRNQQSIKFRENQLDIPLQYHARDHGLRISTCGRYFEPSERISSAASTSLPRPPKGGGYDPFGAFAFRVDATINDLLVFWRSHITSTINDGGDTFAAALVDNAWGLINIAFQEPCQGYAFLAVAAAIYATETESTSMTALAAHFRNVSMTSLRQSLETDGVTGIVPCGMQALLLAEIAAHNYEAARVHAQFLGSLVQPRIGPPLPMPEGGRHSFLWTEIQGAILSFTRPLLDSSRIQCHYSPEIWLPGYKDLHNCLPKSSDLDCEALHNPVLRSMFLELKTYAFIIQTLYWDKVQLSPQSLIRLSTALLSLSGRLLTFSCDMIDEIPQHYDNHTKQSQCFLHAAAALAALYWLRLMIREERSMTRKQGQLFRRNAFAAGPMIAKRIAQFLQASVSDEQITIPQPESHYEVTEGKAPPDLRLRIWILYVGAFIETTTSAQGSCNSFHNRDLNELLDTTGLSNSPRAYRNLIKMFLPLENIDTFVPAWLSPDCRTFGLVRDLPAT